jgi:Ulp1 family protease
LGSSPTIAKFQRTSNINSQANLQNQLGPNLDTNDEFKIGARLPMIKARASSNQNANPVMRELHQMNLQNYPELFAPADSENFDGPRGAFRRSQGELKMRPNLMGGISEPIAHKNSNFGKGENHAKSQKNFNTGAIENCQINQRDLHEIEEKNFVNENCLNYFLMYVKQKQLGMPPSTLQKYKSRGFFFTTDWHRLYVADLDRDMPGYRYDRVKFMTKDFNMGGYTILHSFDKIFFPLVDKGGFKLAVAQPFDKEIIVYDPIT